MQTNFDSQFFRNNRDRLRTAIGSNVPVVIAGNGSMQKGSDEATLFHQDSNFWYLTGLNNPDITLVMLADESYLIVPTLSHTREAFDGAHDTAAYASRSGIPTVLTERDGWQKLKAELRPGSTIATLASPAPYIKQYGLHSLPYRRRLQARLKRFEPSIQFQDVRSQLASLRCLKQPPELQAIQRAIDITTAALVDITTPASLHTARYEYQLEAALFYGFRSRGADGHSFQPIVGAGAHGTTLHHVSNEGPIERDDLIVLDVGAQVEHYTSDITRTVSAQPITGRKAAVFKAVERVQAYALDLMRPGVLARDYEQAVETYMGQQLQALGLITEPTHQQIRRYFPHATSHFLGLDTHDVGDYSAPWAENMVLTCEPGIYIPEEGIGVRLEDDVLITKTGAQVLSRACPTRLTPVQ